MGRFLSLVVEYRHRIGVTGTILIEPEPKQPTEHQHSVASALDILGSLDVDRGDRLLGRDTERFPHSVQDAALALYYVLQSGGLGRAAG